MKRIVSGIMLILLLISMLTLAFDIQPVKAEPKTWYVDDSGGADFTKIQDAIYAASSGDTIYVYNGTYYEHLYIYTSLTIVGESKYGTIIDGMGSGTIVTMIASNMNFTGFTIRNTGGQQYDAAVLLLGLASCCVYGNIIRDVRGAEWVRGIQVLGSHDQVIGNTILNIGECAIWVGYYSNAIAENTISDCQVGIYLADGSHDNTVVGNAVSNCSGDATYGILVWGYNNRIIDNTVANVPYTGIRLNSPSEYPKQCTNNVVSGNVVSNSSGSGIEVGFASFSNTIIGNNVSSSGSGITLSSNSTDNIVANNILTDNSLGIYLGINEYDQSNNNILLGNMLANNDYGIYIFYSSNTELIKNNLTANTYSNIYIFLSSGNTICGNLISNSQNGLMFLYSSDNNVCHNNFVNNTEQVYSYDSVNVWDDGYPSGGNYWSDYEERYPDAGEIDDSGIWDKLYVIDENNTDRYPLMKPYVALLGDLDRDRDVDEDDLWYFCGAFIDYYKIHVYDPLCDFNRDLEIDEDDLWKMCEGFIDYWKVH
jgi:parallel beta-helix repeat protein